MNEALAPGFLVAVPQLQDPNFRLAVVLLLEQNEDGAMGVVINHASDLLLGDLCRDNDIQYQGEPTKPMRSGGPVRPEQGLLLYGPEHDDTDGHEVVAGLHVSASKGTLERLCSLKTGRFHCFCGYAGWGPEQLEQEISQGVWLAVPADAELVLDADPQQIWSAALRTNGIDPAALVPGGAEEA